nr:immunoglobulin light chain junction region [Macaca mulatta]MOV72218.1 immunoglobulin light chain junction region [Macaca mulatta]MOV72623.1 immunoglobulin light chain junction region [Macaca mulatta]MOV72783.1 immunoglobulin light chain junction region [Macaca mulatta]MOV72888.1 immunoglobulin light chain junction region [Macaca mulatta]
DYYCYSRDSSENQSVF